jgi:hypothetical protein
MIRAFCRTLFSEEDIMEQVSLVFPRKICIRYYSGLTFSRVLLNLVCVGMLFGAAVTTFAQAPGWSRGQQNLAITYDECVSRMPAALQAEGYRIDRAAGDFAVGIKDVHAAVIICSPGPNSTMFVQIVVASNGDGGGTERQRLQARMEQAGVAPRPGPTPGGNVGSSGGTSGGGTNPRNGVGGTSIKWSDYPVFSQRGSDKSGQRSTYTCTPNGTPASVWGTDYYTDDSSLCTAAVHAGLISFASGGTVTVEVRRPGLNHYKGSSRNGVVSHDYDNGPYQTPGAFSFVGGGTALGTATPNGTTTAAGGGTSSGLIGGGSGTAGAVAGGGAVIKWGDYPLTSHRGYDKSGQRSTYTCPPNGTPASIWGTDYYTDDSSLCTAAVHAGLISFASGGTVTVEVQRPGLARYVGSTRNGVTSRDYDNGPNPSLGAFVFVGGNPAAGGTGRLAGGNPGGANIPVGGNAPGYAPPPGAVGSAGAGIGNGAVITRGVPSAGGPGGPAGGDVFGPRQDNYSLNGTTLTYYPQPTVDQCQLDCANNGNCKAYTWIQAATFNPTDPAMCYLISAVTGGQRDPRHISAIKGGGNSSGLSGGGGGGGNIGPVAAAGKIIKWSDSPLIPARGYDKNGQRTTYTCPPNGTPASGVTGTDVYMDDSPICTAAVHAGLISFASGGTVTVEVRRPGLPRYAGSARNGVSSNNYDNGPNPTLGAFVFIK